MAAESSVTGISRTSAVREPNRPERVDSQTVEILRKCANGGWTRFVRRLSALPKDLVLEITEQYTDGRRFERRLVLEKQ